MDLNTILSHLTPLPITTGLILITTGIGLSCFQKTSLKFITKTERCIFAAAVGLGLLGYAIFALSASQMLYTVSIHVVMGIFAIPAGYGWMNFIRASKPQSVEKKSQSLGKSEICIGCILILSLLSGLLFVLTPETGTDALSYHLAVPKHYLSNHGFCFIPGNLFSNYPLFGEMLYTIGLALNNDILAKCIHFLVTLLLMAGIYHFSKTYISQEYPALLAVLVFFTIPSVFINGVRAYTDLTLAFYAFLAVWAYIKWHQRTETGWLVLCAIFTGLAAATKYAGLFLPFLGVLGICLTSRDRGIAVKDASRSLLTYILIFIIIASPFYIKNWILTGNPMYPFFYSIFGGKGWDETLARYYDLFLHNLGMGRDLMDYLLLPWNLSFHAKIDSPQFDGIIGPIFLLTLPFLFFIRKWALAVKIGSIFSGLMFLFWAASAQQIRYLVPILPFLSIATGYVLFRFRQHKVIKPILVFIIGCCIGLNGFHIVGQFQKTRPDRYILGYEDRDAYLTRVIPSYNMIRFVNTHLPRNSKVFLIYMKNLGYLHERAFYSDSMFESHTIQKILSRSLTPEAIYRALAAKGFTHLLYDVRYLFGKFSTFSLKEKDRFAEFQTRYLELIKTSNSGYYLYAL